MDWPVVWTALSDTRQARNGPMTPAVGKPGFVRVSGQPAHSLSPCRLPRAPHVVGPSDPSSVKPGLHALLGHLTHTQYPARRAHCAPSHLLRLCQHPRPVLRRISPQARERERHTPQLTLAGQASAASLLVSP